MLHVTSRHVLVDSRTQTARGFGHAQGQGWQSPLPAAATQGSPVVTKQYCWSDTLRTWAQPPMRTAAIRKIVSCRMGASIYLAVNRRRPQQRFHSPFGTVGGRIQERVRIR